MLNSILKFLGGKWFVLALMCLMGMLLPTTYSNMMVVVAKEQLAAFWYIPAVFLCNVGGMLLVFWKFMGLISKPKTSQPVANTAW